MATASKPATRHPIRPAHGVCRLTLTLNGARYAVRPVRCDREAALRCYSLRKADGTQYNVAQTIHGAECDCPDFAFHRDGVDPNGCKHIRALAVLGMLD